jgi:hypothetical protein
MNMKVRRRLIFLSPDLLISGIASQPVASGHHFYIGWLLGGYLPVLGAIDTARSMANVPEWEFAIEFTLDGTAGAPRLTAGKSA